VAVEREQKAAWTERFWARVVPALQRRASGEGVCFRVRTTSFDLLSLTLLLATVGVLGPTLIVYRLAADDPKLRWAAMVWTAAAALLVAPLVVLQVTARRLVTIDRHRVLVRGPLARQQTLDAMTLRIDVVAHDYRWYELQSLASTSDRHRTVRRQRFDVSLRSEEGAPIVLPVRLPTEAEARALADELRAAVESVRVPAGYRDV
jgi:hypothetical protein